MAHPARDAVERRRSHSKVTAEAPSHEQLLPLVAAAGGVADHGSLHPWRLIELRGADRARLGDALAEASGLEGKDAAKLAEKPLRASLLIAVVAVHQPSFKVPEWEQDATAAGVAHVLSLLLDEAGWGVIWRTGGHTRSEPVRRMHGLADNEVLLGWLYVGGIVPDKSKPGRKLIDPTRYLTAL
ncbi:nitroreductase [Microbacteriaceae bacterium SG_E_30_P1]|uniref:Putative NAD(P)H nitroreductase n=1 Tax=Antiquaquibacter oligotrophicus TaxID=2880260 RepID=A0ABT6KJG7_9MICO|nr:nitroreductase family protein [Antiquaquibacter oligotrophicus]MDH6180135.1 nitroreductase [Antiquaquibacter oligotrophicus]UDF14114.1 nitroreductase family protein [Antiquaquibacter oligotrophicus]